MLLDNFKIIPVVVVNSMEDAKVKFSALDEAKLYVAEVTLRTPCALDAIEYCSTNYKNIIVGAGTVLNANQASEAVKRGAKFIVSPGSSDDLYEFCKSYNIEFYPGCVTPSEIMKAINHGYNVLKFFPANVYGGLKALKALSGPFPQVKFIPTGGVDLTNIKEYIDSPFVKSIGGSFFMKGTKEEMILKIKEALKLVEA